MIGVSLSLAGLFAFGVGASGTRHVRLLRSEPAMNDTVQAAPTQLRLWFSEAPELAVTSIKLTSTSALAVSVGPLTRDKAADAPVVAPVKVVLPPGQYLVTWKTTADDGHPAGGRIAFVVAPPATAH